MITFQQKGDFKKTLTFMERALEILRLGKLDKYGDMGVKALSSVTPVDTGETAKSWYYEIKRNRNSVSINWCNSNMDNDGNCPVAILLQYGHADRSGLFVKGTDYINPAIRPIFDEIAEGIWKEVTRL